jgi:ATP-dependent RNA helicase RhlE
MNEFSELQLSPTIQHNLTRNLLVKPTPVQAEAIPPALAGADVVATARTGTGKTIAFLLPIIEKLLKSAESPAPTPNNGRRVQPKQIKALVLSPTRELAIQIADAFSMLTVGTGLRAAIVVGGMSEQAQLNNIRRGVQLVVATPGRLEDYLGRQLIDLNSVETLVLDEADRMLDMGFLPAIEKILNRLPAKRQNMFFSATMEKDVERLIRRHSNSPVRIAIESSATRTPDEIELSVYEVNADQKLNLLRHILETESGSFLVFARTKHSTDRLAKRLSSLGTRAVAMHGDRTQNQRNQALAGFRDGRYRVLVATDVAARGIHVDSVAHVVNYDLPQAPEDFIHRVGRTGRAGQRGLASTFGTRAERGEIRRIERECKVRLKRRDVAQEILDAPLPEPVHQPVQKDLAPARREFTHVRDENRSYKPKQKFGANRGRSFGRRDERPAGGYQSSSWRAGA